CQTWDPQYIARTRGRRARPKPSNRQTAQLPGFAAHHPGRPQLRLRELALELQADPRGDVLDRARIAHQVILPHIEAEHGTLAEPIDPSPISLVQSRPVVDSNVSLLRPS